jgi:hypothetical protein
LILHKFKPEKYRELLEKKRSEERMESRINQGLYIIEFIIGFILAGIGIFVILTILFCTGFMQLYCDILFPFKSLSIYYGVLFSTMALSIGLALIIDGFLRFKRIRMIQIKARKHLPLESVPATVSREKKGIYCIIIYSIVFIVFGVLYLLVY